MAHFLQQGHTYSNKATPPNSVTPYKPMIQTHESMGGHTYSNHHSYPHSKEYIVIWITFCEHIVYRGFNFSSFVDGSICPAQSRSYSIPKKHTEAYIDYKRFGLLAQAYYELALTT